MTHIYNLIHLENSEKKIMVEAYNYIYEQMLLLFFWRRRRVWKRKLVL